MMALPALISLGDSSGSVSAAADDQDASTSSSLFTRRDEAGKFAYQFQPPSPDCKPANKPLKTHLDEINFVSTSTSGYQYGITVDPVRINSLREFGSPEEVAAKVVLAEVNRDGVFDVKLMEDPASGNDSGDDKAYYYQLNYRSNGKRGVKRYVAKFLIQDKRLYTITAQCKEDDYQRLEGEIKRAVDSFRSY